MLPQKVSPDSENIQPHQFKVDKYMTLSYSILRYTSAVPGYQRVPGRMCFPLRMSPQRRPVQATVSCLFGDAAVGLMQNKTVQGLDGRFIHCSVG